MTRRTCAGRSTRQQRTGSGPRFLEGVFIPLPREVPAEEMLTSSAHCSSQAYEQPVERCADRKAGFRILPLSPTSYYQDGRLPSGRRTFCSAPTNRRAASPIC